MEPGRQREFWTSQTGSVSGQQWRLSAQHVALSIGQQAHCRQVPTSSCMQQHVVPGRHSLALSQVTGPLGGGLGGDGGSGAANGKASEG